MIRFVHTADIHFGMENYGRIDSKTGIHSRLLDFKKALDFCIDVTIEKKVDFFLFSGDAYKTTTPSPTQQKLLLQCFLRLYKKNIPIVIVVGNHDNPLSFGKAHSLDVFGSLPLDGFHVISKPKTITLKTKNGPIQIVGIPWPTRNSISLNKKHQLKNATQITEYISKAVAQIIKNSAEKLDQKIPAVLAGHLTVTSGIFSGSEKRAIYGTDPVLLPSDLAIKPFDYVALGHLHRYQDLNKNGYPAIVYSGSIERIDFGERKEEKGFCLVTIEEKDKTTHEFIQVPTRPFIQIEVKLKAKESHTQQVLDALAKKTIKNAVIKIVYHVPPEEPDKVDLKKVQLYCADAWYLVGIIPIRKPITRQRRTGAHVDMDLSTLLKTYFSSKDEFKDRTDELVEKALLLSNELEQKEL